jgi:hypothetical protein
MERTISTRYLVNDASVLLDKANIYASFFNLKAGFRFNYVDKTGKEVKLL